MNIKKISLTANGFKGAEISFLTQTFKNNRPFLNETIEKRKNPIHGDMEKLFKDLRIHLLDVCKINNNRLSEAEQKTVILETDISSIEFDNDSFLLSGETEVFEGKTIKLKTCKVQESDGYEGYAEVRGIIDELKVEATAYLDGLKVVSDREMMLRWLEARKDHNMTREQFDEMSEEDQKKYMNKTLNAKFGAEIDTDEDVEEEEGEEEGFEIGGEEIVVPEAKEKKGKKKNEVTSEGGGF
jgi:hypothetical protein